MLYPVLENNKQMDYLQSKKGLAKVETLDDAVKLSAIDSIPFFRRGASIEDKARNDDYIGIAGSVGLIALNAPEDWRDMKGSAKQIRKFLNPKYNYDPLYNRKTHQHAFSFLRGTAIEEWVSKKVDKGSKLASQLYDLDRYTLYETKFGKMMQKAFGIKELETSHLVEKIHDIRGRKATASQFKSTVFGGETIARAMKRLPVLSIIAAGLLELPKIVKAMGEGENITAQTQNTAKQTAKSGINIASTFAGIGTFGALGAKYGGATGSLVGMGIGAVVGNIMSKKAQSFIV